MNRNHGQQVDSIVRRNKVTASWVLREAESKRVICETFDKRVVEKLNTAKYQAVPILDYLLEFNATARNQQ
ncbi:hypothetical protein [Cupriavidus sp. UYPR2.512]|uniref:hypothetical protein n=1 Tax=Cupriavidus sp. UYPR2.512 TaxID=1080187 RepID=UPI0012FC921C|nr:hypothetical protein [Cupriavidus sp. UYPR2.512]UIF89453.1 hypothetical protein KAF44_29740 [Cupriavidus necator]